MCDVVCSTGPHRCVMICIHNIVSPTNVYCPKILCAPPLSIHLFPLPLAITSIFSLFPWFCLSRMSSSWNHAVHSHFWLGFSTMHSISSCLFHSLIDHFLLALIVYCLMSQSLFIHSPSERHFDCFQGLAFVNEHPCADFHVAISFSTLKRIIESYGKKSVFSLVETVKTTFQSCCTVLRSHSAMYESSCCSPAPAVVLAVVDLNHYSKCIVVFHCCFNFISLITHYMEHLFSKAHLPSIDLLWWSVCYGLWLLLTRLFSYYNLKRSFVYFRHQPFIRCVFGKYFSQSVTYFLILLTLSSSLSRDFYFNEVMPLLLYHHTQGHVGFLLCYLLGVL